jgi:hypothetical protein
MNFFIFRFESFFKTSPFGPTIMHGGAIALNPAMHGGGVQAPRGMLQASVERGTPPCIMAGYP